MANYTMHHLNVGSNTYEIVDSVARVGAEAAFATDTASGTVATFSDGADGVPVKSLSVAVEAVQSGSGDPAPDNVRAIGGWDSVKVTRTGTNIFGGELLKDGVMYALPGSTVDDENKTVRFYAGGNSSIAFTELCGLSGKFKQNTQYTLIMTLSKDTGNGTNIRVYYTDGTYSVVPPLSSTGVKETSVLVTTAGKTVFSIRKTAASGHTTLYYDESGVFEGVHTADDFVLYDGDVYDIALPQTVYGGTLDVTSGVLTLTKKAVTLNGSESWSMYASGKFYASTIEVNVAAESNNYISNLYQFWGDGASKSVNVTTDKRFYGQRSLGRFWVYDSSYTSVDDFKTALASTPMTIVYPLTTTETLTLTPEQVTTLLGQNNIYSDAGEVSVTYRADTGLYINKRLNA